MISRRKFIVNNINFGISGLLLNSRPTFFTNIHSEKFNKKIKLKPTLIGDWWLIGPPPRDFDNKSLLNTEELGSTSGFESVDHHIFRGHDDYWHLWGCVRGTGLGRILYHWKAKRLTDSPWEYTGEFIRSEISFGESIDD